MTASRLALADELAEIRAEIARLKQRETALASLEHCFPKVPVFRRQRSAERTLQGANCAASAHA
ncbi:MULTISPECIES: hypothetical protein [Tabrizicola]|uniref:hypothetical protein n=1 Tax=Tabrizicola TaxID=1443919 RepID=UPI0010818C50|nr:MULTISPECIES: hypothetical protein [Paracoccaceae]